ncbi:MAG: phosphoribosylglycinamide formyltransferase [Elusimicrobia bacterium]|nr:phosphoribosylglycinamide formyltransferase [Elusimicrobiota bacterium]
MKDKKAVRIAVFASGKGTNLQSIIDGCRRGDIPGKVVFVLSDNSHAFAISRAKRAGIETVILARRRYKSDETYSARMLKEVRKRKIDLICLAGFLLKLPEPVVREYRNRILNIHPALLPKFGGKGMYGLRVHREVLRKGEKISGCSVHFVDEKYDHGRVFLRKVVKVKKTDTPETLQERILKEEHILFPKAVRKWVDEFYEEQKND